MNAFITKPVEAAVLYRTLVSLIAGSRTEQEPLRPTQGSDVIVAGNELPDSGAYYSMVVRDKDSNHGDCRDFLAVPKSGR